MGWVLGDSVVQRSPSGHKELLPAAGGRLHLRHNHFGKQPGANFTKIENVRYSDSSPRYSHVGARAHTYTCSHKYYRVREKFHEPLLALVMCDAC